MHLNVKHYLDYSSFIIRDIYGTQSYNVCPEKLTWHWLKLLLDTLSELASSGILVQKIKSETSIEMQLQI